MTNAPRGSADWAVTPDLGPDSLWRIGSRVFDFRHRVAVMAIVNRTRDSFYDQGATFAWDAAMRAVDDAVAAGADWVDIGGVPFSPNAQPVSPAQEHDAVVPFIAAVRGRHDVVLSVDTARAEVAEAALAAGADVINDTSGVADGELARVVARYDGSLVVCHSRSDLPPGFPVEDVAAARVRYHDVVAEVRDFLVAGVRRAVDAGVSPARIIVDPGHDLHKNTLHSLEITRRLDVFARLGHPLLVAVSNKDFIGETLDVERSERLAGTVATHVACILRGARIIRVHDVKAGVSAARMTEAIVGWREPKVLRHNYFPVDPH
ncbi:MAG: dihydropteroate synthase [Actinomycetota bacterium]